MEFGTTPEDVADHETKSMLSLDSETSKYFVRCYETRESVRIAWSYEREGMKPGLDHSLGCLEASDAFYQMKELARFKARAQVIWQHFGAEEIDHWQELYRKARQITLKK